MDGLGDLVDDVVDEVLFQLTTHFLIQLVHCVSELVNFSVVNEELEVTFKLTDFPNLIELLSQLLVEAETLPG